MATAVNFKRIICPAVESVGFQSQVDVYFRDENRTDESRLDLRKVTTANIGLVEGKLLADFHLGEDFFTVPEEVVVESVIAEGWPEAMTTHDAIRVTGIIITRKPKSDMP